MTNYAVSLENVSFSYDKKAVLKELSLSISQNRICFIMGNNGSGKTTLLKNIMGFLIPQKGVIRISEKDVATIDRHSMSKIISYVPQAIHMNTDFSVIDYLSLGRTPHIGIFKNMRKIDYEIIERYSNKLCIENIYDSSFNKLSGGQKQMVAIARSLIQDTPLIILDEPMSALDVGKQVELLKLLYELTKKGKTIILTSHNPNHALAVESDSCFIDHGQLINYGSSKSIITNELLHSIYGDNISLSHGRVNESVVFNVNSKT